MKAAIVFHVKSFLAQAHAEEPQPKATKRHHEEGLLHTRGCARGSLNSGEHSPGCMGICIYTYVHKHVPKYIYIYIYVRAYMHTLQVLHRLHYTLASTAHYIHTGCVRLIPSALLRQSHLEPSTS